MRVRIWEARKKLKILNALTACPVLSLNTQRKFKMLGGNVFTRDQIEGYMELKWEEIYEYEHTPHPVEFQMYYSV